MISYKTFNFDVGDEELCYLIRQYMQENVRRGEKMVEGLLLSLGHRVRRR